MLQNVHGKESKSQNKLKYNPIMVSYLNFFLLPQPNLLEKWIEEFVSHVKQVQPDFIGLHLQEVGGKTYEKSMEYVQKFIQMLCEAKDFQDFDRIRVFLDEDYNSAEHFTVSYTYYFTYIFIVFNTLFNEKKQCKVR